MAESSKPEIKKPTPKMPSLGDIVKVNMLRQMEDYIRGKIKAHITRSHENMLRQKNGEPQIKEDEKTQADWDKEAEEQRNSDLERFKIKFGREPGKPTIKDWKKAGKHLKKFGSQPNGNVRYTKEEAPTNSMGSSSSTSMTGNVDTFDPLLFSKIYRRKKLIQQKPLN